MSRLSLTIGLAAMDMCWVYPWAVLLGAWSDLSRPRPLLSPASAFGLVFLGALSTRVLGRRAARSRFARFALVALGVLAVLIVERLDQYTDGGSVEWLGSLLGALAVVLGRFSGPAMTFALGLYLWWRGVRLGSQAASYTDVEAAFRWGIGLLVGFALVLALTTRPTQLPALEGQTTLYVVGFFFASLLTLALGRLESLRTRTRALAVNSQWLGVLIVVSGLIVVVSLLIGQLLSFDLLIMVTRPLFDLLGSVLLLVVYVLVIPLAYLVELLVYALLSLLRAVPDQKPPQPLQQSDLDSLLQRFLSQQLPPELLLAVKAIGAALLVALGLVLLARAARRWRPSSADADAAEEERDSLWEPGRLRRAVLAWLRNLFRRMAQREPPVGTATMTGHVDTEATLSSIRDVYRQLLTVGEAAGVRRAAATTPLEHQPALLQVLEPEEDVARLTDAYLEVRYADIEAAPADVAASRRGLDRVHPKNAGS